MDEQKEKKEFEIELKKSKSKKGAVEAVFSVFNNKDSDGDVVIPGAVRSGFKSGDVPMVWSHKWDMPIGKGKIKQDNDKATFEGNFFMDTEAGKEAYNLVKSMGDLQQWSFGFRVEDSEVGKWQKNADAEEETARYLKDLTVYEVSPVLVGANQETYTMAIKEASEKDELEKKVVDTESMDEEKAAYAKDTFDNPGEAMNRSKELSCAVGVHTHEVDGKEVFMPCKTHEEYEEAVGKSIDEETEIKDVETNDPEPEDEMGEEIVEESDTPEDDVSEEKDSGKAPSLTGLTFSEEVKDVLAALDSLIVRAKAIGLLRVKDGRKLSEKATEALNAVREDLNDAWTEIDEIIEEVGTLPEATATAVEEEVEVDDVDTEIEEVVETEVEEVAVEEVEETEEAEIAEAEVEVTEEVEVPVEAVTEEVATDEIDEDLESLLMETQRTIADSLIAETEEEDEI